MVHAAHITTSFARPAWWQAIEEVTTPYTSHCWLDSTVSVEQVHTALNGRECTLVRMLSPSLGPRTQHDHYMHVPSITITFVCRKRDANSSCPVHCSPCIHAITSSVSHVATGLYTLAPLSILSVFLVFLSRVLYCNCASEFFCRTMYAVGGVTAPT